MLACGLEVASIMSSRDYACDLFDVEVHLVSLVDGLICKHLSTPCDVTKIYLALQV